MDSLSSFFSMGGYGVFIWPSYGLSAILLAGILISNIRSLKYNRMALLNLENSGQVSNPQGTVNK